MKLGVASHRSIAPVWETVPIGRAAIRALYAELALHPKPGLVSPLDSGSHDDMDMTTFMRSLFALRGYYRDIAAAGARGADFATLQAWASPPSGACSQPPAASTPTRRGVRAWPADRRRRLAAPHRKAAARPSAGRGGGDAVGR